MFIELTTLQGRSILVNANQITLIEGSDDRTNVFFGHDRSVSVSETYQTVLNKITEEEKRLGRAVA